MTVGGASGSPAVFQGEATRQRAGALTPYPRFPAAMPPRIEGAGRERHLQNPWRGGIPMAWRMHLGVTHGGRKGRGQGIDPFPDVSRRRHAAPRRGNRQGKVFAKSMERRDPSGLVNASRGHTRGPPGAGYLSLPRYFPPRPYGPASGESAGKGICKIHGKARSQWLGKCIVGSHTGTARGGVGSWPFNLGFPPPQRRSANKVIGGRPPSHGVRGHLMHGARGAEKGG